MRTGREPIADTSDDTGRGTCQAEPERRETAFLFGVGNPKGVKICKGNTKGVKICNLSLQRRAGEDRFDAWLGN